jgi:hypothetical protein
MLIFKPQKILVLSLFLVLVIFSLSCQKQTATSFETVSETSKIKEIPKDWQKIDTDFFSFSIPPTIKENDVEGIDSQVMQFENAEITLDLDFGMYSTDVEFSTRYFESEKTLVTIDERTTALVKYDANKPLSSPTGAVNADGSTKFGKVEKNFVIGVNFQRERGLTSPDFPFDASFIARCKTLEAQETAKKILYSIKFKKI